jgi:rod shape-determining protein MreC
MTRKMWLAILFPFTVALALFLLPEKRNHALRNLLAEKLLALHSSTLSQKEQEAREFQEGPYCVARVIFRNHNRWNSSLWIDMGSDGSTLIAKNSPVLSGDALVGVIDYVGKNASCARLITDSALTPSVRVARNLPDKALNAAIQTVLSTLEHSDEHNRLREQLIKLQEAKLQPKEPQFLAKGILQGHGEPLWKAQSPLLKGYGFNYDFRDAHGPARELRSGDLVKVGDLLITSGMDGIFPEGLKVARVHSIAPLTEGAFAYELLAEPCAQDILDLEFVTILPPQGFDESLIPTPLEQTLEQLNN